MQYFFVGLAMRNHTHDYGPVHAALFGMKAQRVSSRIWLCGIASSLVDRALEHISRALAEGDEMLVVEASQELMREAA